MTDEPQTPAHEAPTPTKRPVVPALEEMMGVSIPCLDHGFVRLVDYMGDDHAVVQAARVSLWHGARSACARIAGSSATSCGTGTRPRSRCAS